MNDIWIELSHRVDVGMGLLFMSTSHYKLGYSDSQQGKSGPPPESRRDTVARLEWTSFTRSK